jgi:hypothetical protein
LNAVPYDNGFHFYTGIGNYTGVTATSLAEFAEKLQTIDNSSIRFHFQRADFRKWIKNTIGDPELAKRMNMIKPELSDEKLRQELLKVVQARIVELKAFV